MKNLISSFIASITFLLLTSCLQSTPKSIEWDKRGIESALQKAKIEQKPLFVYWGAKWCPPCNVLKSTVFTQANVIKATQQYVSVYLDGDTEDAQIWGERLHASGYPTLMLLNSEGKELYRASNLLDAQTFAQVLNEFAKHKISISTLVKNTLEKKSATPSEWKQITDYAWTQHPDEKDKIKSSETFHKLESIAKDPAVKTKLFYISWILHTEELADKALPKSEQKSYHDQLMKTLSNPKDVADNIKHLGYWSQEFTKSLETLGTRTETFLAYKNAMKTFIENNSKDTHSQLVALYPIVLLSQKSKNEKTESTLTEVELEYVKSHIFSAIDKIKDHKTHSHIMNAAVYLLKEADLVDEARELLVQRMKESKTPYYDMATLAYLESHAGNTQKSLEWSKKAYESAEGPATRFQWGVNYVKALVKHAPDKKDEIKKELSSFYKTHVKDESAFFGRNQMRLDQLAQAVKDWIKDKKGEFPKAEISKIRKLCSTTKIAQNSHAKQKCDEHFSKIEI